MTGTTDINIVVGQGTAIKEVHNIRKQSLELNQQLTAQRTEDKRKEDRSKIKEFETEKKIELNTDEEKNNKGGSGENQPFAKREKREEESNMEENLIDIMV